MNDIVSKIFINLLEFEVTKWVLPLSFWRLLFGFGTNCNIFFAFHELISFILLQKFLEMLIVETKLLTLQPTCIFFRRLFKNAR